MAFPLLDTATKEPSTGHVLCLEDTWKRRLKILFLAKWAESDGEPDTEDGTHATYHAELRDTLKAAGYEVEASGRMERLFTPPNYDFLFTMLNRAGFSGSEMLAPLLATFHRKPFLGATPILRGLGDDKHLMKLVARSRGVAIPDWTIIRRGALQIAPPSFDWEALIVKPNASSASWGIKVCRSWPEARHHAQELLEVGHDIIVERFVDGYEIALPVIGSNGPWFLPPMRYRSDDLTRVRTYEQKRDLAPSDGFHLEPLGDTGLCARVRDAGRRLLPELWPFDSGRFEFKYDAAMDTLHFIEVNLSCNLWSRKSTSRAAANLGVTHTQLIETILCHSLRRQGVVPASSVLSIPVEA